MDVAFHLSILDLCHRNPILWLHRYREVLSSLVGCHLDGQTSTLVVFVVFSLAHLETQYLVSLARRLNEEDELMKKRTLVCFLIFTLCVFYTSIPSTVLGQEASLAEQVHEKYSELLGRDDIKAVLPQVLEGLKAPNIQAILSANPALIGTVVDAPDLLLNFAPDTDPQFIQLLKEDAALQGMLKDPQVQSLLADLDAIDELAGLLGVGAEPPVEEPTTPPVEEPTTPPVEEPTTPPVEEPTTPPVEEPTTPPVEEPTTPPVEEPTTPPVEEPTTPPVEEPTTPLPVEVPMAEPFDPIMPTNDYLLGQSRLGGLSLNAVPGRGFIEAIAREIKLPLGAEALVDAIVDMVPQGFLSKRQISQIRGMLLAKRLAIFENEARHLDYENFGNAITPDFADFAYLERSNKHLTRDSLQVYMRVPAEVGGVTFNLTGGRTVEGTEVTPDEFQADTIPYTFQLEERLAAGHLPAWPSLSTQQLFSRVTLRYSNTGHDGQYASFPMESIVGANGVVWETDKVGITPGSTFYYFEVVLAEPLVFKTLDRGKLADMFEEMTMGSTPSLEEILSATLDPPLTIEGWAMPDPRNLQIVDRGIIKALFTDDLRRVIDSIVTSPRATNVIQKALADQSINVNDFLSAATQKQQNRIRAILARNANRIVTKFETAFDPMLASVFTVRRPTQGSSLWVANIDDLADGNYYLGAVVHDADGNPLDQIQETFTVDTTAPEADIQIMLGENATGYMNEEGIYVAATKPDSSATGTLNIMGMPKRADVGAGQGYLFYQEVALDADGNPLSTWMPLTVSSTMLTSRIWSALVERQGEQLVPFLKQMAPELVGGLDDAAIQGLLATMTPQSILALLSPEMILGGLNPFLKNLDPVIGRVRLNEDQAQLVIDALGATVDIVDHLVPVTFEPSEYVVMPLMIGEYGIRAMGIDTLFNVGSYAEPTRVRVVMPEYDMASVTAVMIGDCNLDGDMNDPLESGLIGDMTIFGNTTENVVLTVTVDNRTAHPATVMVQYMDASGAWQNIGELDLAGTETGSTFEVNWNVADFDALAAAGETVMVRAVASNALTLTDLNPMVGSINLDTGICPLDPEVVAISVDAPTAMNPDSGGPQGMLTLNAYTPSRTSTPISSVRLMAKGPQDAEWMIESSEAVEQVEGQELADILGDLVSTVGPDKPVIQVNSTYQKWVVSIDTTTLEDTITADSPAARDAAKDENPYVVHGYANTNGTEVPPIPGVQAMFSVDNVDDVAPLGPTNVSVTSVDATDSVFETAEDGSSTVGGLVDKYDAEVASPVATLTVEPTAARNTYESVRLVPDAEGLLIGEVTETAEGSGVFTVTVDVGTLADGETYVENGTYMFHALAADAAGNEQADESDTDGSKISVTVENSYRPAPEIFAITTDPAMQTNPDSGGPQGTVTLNSYTLGERTSPPVTSMRFEVKRQDADDAEWTEVGATAEGAAVTEEEFQELKAQNADFLADLIHTAAETVAGGEATAPIHKHEAYQRWSVDIDTVALELEDTITADGAAARDVSLDANPYVVRAIAVSAANEGETAAPSGVKSMFSLDNVDDVAPLGPTNITAVAHVNENGEVVEAVDANEDGSYTVGGIVDETVPSPMAMLTVEPTAVMDTYAEGSIRLVQTDADGTQTAVDSEPGMLEAPTVDVGMLENGTYMFHALVVDAFGNVQADDSETDGSRITVHVLNFRVSDIMDLAVIAVDGVDVAEPPAEPISLRGSVSVSFVVANGSLAPEELSGAVHGTEVPSDSAEDPENTFSLTVMELSAMPDGMYTPDGVVTQWNGSVPFPLAGINLDNTGPMVTIQTPSEDHTLDSLPTVHATYEDGAGSGSDADGQGVLAWATTELAEGPTVGITRILPEQGDVEIDVDQNAIETNDTTLVYTRSEQLSGGAYRVTVHVADVLGNIGEASVEFAISGTLPAVAIHSPASGQTFEHGEPLISGEFSGAGTVEVTTFTVNDVAATPAVDGNRFSYTPEEALADGDHTVVVAVTDGDGNMAQTSVAFTVKVPKDTTPPVISATAPSGVIKGDSWVTISAVVTDEQSSVVSVKFAVNDKPFRSVPLAQIAEGRVQIADSFTAGAHDVTVRAISEGGTTEHSWTFTLEVDNVAPTITSITPTGTIRAGLPTISASANDESGVDEIDIVVFDSDGEEVKGDTEDDGEDDVEGITRLDFMPEAPLDEGTYTIEVRATDTIGNSATAKGTFSIDFDTAAPVITMSSPQNEARLTERRPQISITYADAESGVDVDSIRFVFDDKLINLKPNQKTASQVIYTPDIDLAFGQHSVKLEVSDMAHKEGNVSEKSSGAREANMAVHEFTFFVESEAGPVLAARPINAPNPFKENTRISFTLTRQSTVSIVIYDMTLRPVRVLVDNEVWDAGEYVGKAAIGWDGTSSSGEDLARGVYFCQIMVADGFEPEYAILKLALTR